MQKIRMNTEYRNKLFNRIKDVFEKEETQEQQAFMQSRELFNESQKNTFDLARQVVERSYPTDDVATLRKFKKKYGDPCDVVAKDKCFYFAHNEDVNDEGEEEETQSHFDFGLYGNLNGNEYGGGDDSNQFAHAYYREELKEKGCNPDIIAQQHGKDENPHKTKHVDANNKFLGKSSHRSYGEDSGIGMTKQFDEQYQLDVIGTSHCRSRAIACTKKEYEIFLAWRSAKANVVSKHQTWIDSITKQCDQLKIGLKAYRYLSEGIELATELGIKVDEAELVRTNSTGLTIYNPSNLASMIKGMKNKNQTREDKIKARLQYEKQALN
jgi:hypothetical protein|tara:strand:+ start:311 stop:1285 length:975 start_codon:yes stop_codon:yes gene_type:complete